jgi:peptidoglycan/LPS O-acetylase OafA/YrhL
MLFANSDHLAHPKYRPDIDGLRGIAIILVVIYHAFPAVLPGGFVGVDVFFVISGFLISAIVFDNLQRGSFSFFAFYAHRVRRIFPALILVLAACLVAGWFYLVFDEYYRLTKHIAGGSLFISNFLLWGESSYFDHAAYTKPLLHLWSLAVEEQFYLIWPPLLWAAYKLKKNWLPVAIAVTVVSFAVNLWLARSDSSGAFFLPQARIWQPLAGGLLAYFFLYRRNRSAATASDSTSLDQTRMGIGARWREGVSLAGLTAIAGCLFLVDDTTSYPGFWGLLPTLGAMLIISAGTGAWVNRYLVGNPVLVWVGLISYPLYLWHWPLLSFLRITQGPSAPGWIVFAAVTAAGLLAWLTYRLVERPIRRRQANPRRVAILAFLLLAVGSTSFALHRMHSVLERAIDPQAYALVHYDYFQGKTQEEFWKGSCFSLTDRYQFFQQNGCERLAFPGRPKVMLIGDSHAAHISLGLRPYLADRKYNLILVSAAYCTPFSSKDPRSRCPEIEHYVETLVAREKPDYLIMSANYYAYQHSDFNREGDFADFVLRRIREYTALGAKKIILIGQIPVWDDDNLPKILLRRFVLKHRPIPDRTKEGLLTESFAWDEKLRRLPLPSNVTYLSLKDLLCNPSGCMTRVGPDIQTDLIVKDTSHLTAASSAFVTRKLISKAIP